MIRRLSLFRRLQTAVSSGALAIALAGAGLLVTASALSPPAAAGDGLADRLAALRAQFSVPERRRDVPAERERPRSAPSEQGRRSEGGRAGRPGPGETRSVETKPGEAQSAEKKPPVDRRRNLEFLFEALKSAPDADSAKLVEARIMTVWLASGSDTADLLMSRARQAGEAKEHDLGLKLLDTVVELRPDFAEGWNRRATLHFLKKDFGAALDDLRQVLAREPRHFGALVGLGMILQEIEEEKMALTVLRRALELHPHLPRVPEMIRSLTEKVEGRPT